MKSLRASIKNKLAHGFRFFKKNKTAKDIARDILKRRADVFQDLADYDKHHVKTN